MFARAVFHHMAKHWQHFKWQYVLQHFICSHRVSSEMFSLWVMGLFPNHESNFYFPCRISRAIGLELSWGQIATCILFFLFEEWGHRWINMVKTALFVHLNELWYLNLACGIVLFFLYEGLLHSNHCQTRQEPLIFQSVLDCSAIWLKQLDFNHL